MTLRLSLLGPPAIDAGGRTSALPFERGSQLLVFLALKRGWVGRAELAAMFWPEQGPKLALANLRKVLFRMQSSPWADRIVEQDRAMRLDAATDVGEFEAALRDGRIDEALALRRGELLAGFDDDRNEAWTSWLHFERDRLRAAWRSAALAWLDADIDPTAGIALATKLLDDDPLDEAALHAQMTCFAKSGQAARARQAYREFVTRLEADLGLAPGSELRALHDSLAAPGMPPAAARAGAATPFVDDGFVGRSAELRRIAGLLGEDDCRLVTLIGPGGVGKTRLAQRSLSELEDTYADGAAFVELEDATTAELGARLAAALGVAFSGNRDPLDETIEFLRERQMLLVLDNLEQLDAIAPLLDRLLDACPRVKVIATSRVRLAVRGEWLLPLAGLPCPEAEDSDLIEAFDAARLFINAARRIEPALIPSMEAAAIVEICREVEGLPLALELAAAWTRVLSCAAIAAELRQGAELLRATDAAQPARHASIELVFDQSWRLLSAIERDALSRLSVFRGGFTFDAARAVAGASFPVLGALTDKSLLRKDEARLAFHPLVQQLAALRLDDNDARAETERSHARYFHRMLAQLRGPIENSDRDALRQLEIELENCRVAWRWAIGHRAQEALAASVSPLFHFFDHRLRFDEGLALLGEAYGPIAERTKRPSAAPDPLAARFLGAMSHLEYRLDRYAAAEARASEALAAAEDSGDPVDHSALALAHQVLGACALRRGRYADASRFSSKAAQHAQSGSDPRKAAAVLHNQAIAEKSLGHYDESMRLSLQALAQQRRLGDLAGEALSLNNIGLLYLSRHDYAAAGEHLRAGLAICDRHGLSGARLYALANLTELAVHTNEPDAATRYASRALQTAEATGNRALVSWLKLQVARIAVQRGDLAGARSHLGASMQIATAIGRPSLQLEAVACFADVLAAQGESGCASAMLAFAAEHPSIGAPERDAILARLAAQRAAAGKRAAMPAVSLDELAHRIVVETDIAHASLIATLRGN